MNWRPERRTRWANLSTEQHLTFLDDALDDAEQQRDRLTGRLDAMDQQIEEWRLEDAKKRNQMLLAVCLALVGVLGSILVPLLVR